MTSLYTAVASTLKVELNYFWNASFTASACTVNTETIQFKLYAYVYNMSYFAQQLNLKDLNKKVRFFVIKRREKQMVNICATRKHFFSSSIRIDYCVEQVLKANWLWEQRIRGNIFNREFHKNKLLCLMKILRILILLIVLFYQYFE